MVASIGTLADLACVSIVFNIDPKNQRVLNGRKIELSEVAIRHTLSDSVSPAHLSYISPFAPEV